MRTRNAFATLTICVLLALTIVTVVNVYKVSAQSIADCRKVVTGTYLYTTDSGNFSPFRGILTLTKDGNVISTTSIQSTGIPPASQPFSEQQGSWKCTSGREITSTVLHFNYPTTTLPGSITRSDTRTTFDPEAGTIQGTVTGRTFALNANPLVDDVPVSGTFTFTGQRVKPLQ
jgi:hypothetical protein